MTSTIPDGSENPTNDVTPLMARWKAVEQEIKSASELPQGPGRWAANRRWRAKVFAILDELRETRLQLERELAALDEPPFFPDDGVNAPASHDADPDDPQGEPK